MHKQSRGPFNLVPIDPRRNALECHWDRHSRQWGQAAVGASEVNDPKGTGATLTEQGEDFARNMAQATELSQKIWMRFIEGQSTEKASGEVDPLNIAPSFGELLRVLIDNPKQLADATLEYWTAQAALMQQTTLKLLGADDVTSARPDLG